MTIEALNSKIGRRGKAAKSEALPIGETDSNIFNCPACARPLGVGAPRCPGCGTRLIAGVQAARAVAFLSLGLVVGLVVGGGVMAVAATLTRVQPVAAVDGGVVVQPTAAPIATAAPPAATAAPLIDPAVPTAAISALRQTALVNQRVAADAGILAAALAVAEPSSSEIARALRSMSSNATFGERIAADIADWGDGVTVATDLGTFYAAIRSTAAEGLGASLGNDAAYVAAGRDMLSLVQGLAALDAAARSLAAEADVELPVVIVPDGEAVAP